MNGNNGANMKESMDRLSARLEGLTELLRREKTVTVNVRVEGADGAVHDLVSRVLEEVIVRVKQENLIGLMGG